MPGADEDAVRRASASFYKAFESLDISRMEEIWAHDERVVCVHPGWERAVGWPAVRSTWEKVFANTLQINFEVTEVALHVSADLASISVTENLRSWSPGGGGVVGKVLAVNLFERHDGRWRLIANHASPMRGRSSAHDAAVH